MAQIKIFLHPLNEYNNTKKEPFIIKQISKEQYMVDIISVIVISAIVFLALRGFEKIITKINNKSKG